METVWRVLLRFGLLFLCIWMDACKHSETNQPISPTTNQNIIKYRVAEVVSKDTDLGLVMADTSGVESALLYGAKDADGNLLTPMGILFYRRDKGLILDIKISDDYLISEANLLTNNGSQNISFSNYNLTNGTVTIQVTDKVSGQLILNKQQLVLSDNAKKGFGLLQDYVKTAKGGRRVTATCDNWYNIARIYLTTFSCVSSIMEEVLLVAAAPATEGISVLVAIGELPTTALTCHEMRTEYQEYKEGKCTPPSSPKSLPGLLADCGSTSTIYNLLKKKYSEIGSCVTSLVNITFGLPNPLTPTNSPNGSPNGHSTGDPHLLTFDGTSYDFQGHGEFVSAKSTVDNFEIQVRQEDVYKTGYVTMNTGIAVQTGTDVVCVTAKPYKLFVNKQVQDLISLTTLPLKDGASVTKTKQNNLDALNIANKNGDIVKVVFQNADYLDYFIFLADNRKSKVKGLMGNYDADKTNDVQTSAGENILVNGSLSFDKLYSVYSDSWRITSTNSLFYYDSDKNTDTYTQKNFPRTLQTLTAAQKANAESVCRSAGVTLEPFLSNCIYDVAITNNSALANSALIAQTNASGASSSPVSITPPSNSATTIDFNDIKQIQLKGNAKVTNGCIRLTEAAPYLSGAAYYTSTLNDNFESSFTFKLPKSTGGADGFAFIISKDIPTLGAAEGIGYQGTKSSLAIEFDTYQNPNLGDPNDNHISIHTNGQDANSADEKYSIGINAKIITLKDGNSHTVRVVYQNKVIEVFLDGTSVVKANIDLNSKLGLTGSFYIGFTAATGGAYETHDICSWNFKNL